MDITATVLRITKKDAVPDHLARVGVVQCAGAERLDIETFASNPLLSADRKWAIRFGAGGIVTIVLGMRDYGRGCFSAYFANLVAARLGIPFRRIRVYYSANLPAVLQTPVRSLIVSRRSNISPVAEAAAHVIEDMCDQAIEKGRSAFAAISRVSAIDVGFDQPTGRFFVLDRHRSCGVLEIAEHARNGSYMSTEFANETSPN